MKPMRNKRPCAYTTPTGRRCSHDTLNGSDYCRGHIDAAIAQRLGEEPPRTLADMELRQKEGGREDVIPLGTVDLDEWEEWIQRTLRAATRGVSADQWLAELGLPGVTLPADSEQQEHLRKVLRCPPGKEWDAINAQLTELHAIAPRLTRRRASVDLLTKVNELTTTLTAVVALLKEPKLEPPAQPGRGRRGKRVMAQPVHRLRVPTAEPMKDLVAVLGRGEWKEIAGQPAILSALGTTRVRVDCDPALDFGPERAIQVMARKGPSVVQTLLAMIGLWFTKQGEKSRDTYLEGGATDLLRFMGRKPTSGGGFNNAEIMARGRDVFLLMNMSIPQAEQTIYDRHGKATRVQLTITRPVMIEKVAVQRTLDPDDPEAVVAFRFHLGEQLYEWLCGKENPQYAQLSGRLLSYHPEHQKYHILLGFALTYYDRVNRRNGGTRRLGLMRLLELAALEPPKANIGRWQASILKALTELSHDNVIPHLKVVQPSQAEQAQMSARGILKATSVEFPRLLGGASGAKELPDETPASANA